MRKSFLLVLPALLLVAPASSSAQIAIPGCERPATVTVPFALVSVNGQCADLSSLITRVPGSDLWNLTTHLTLAGSVIDLHAVFNQSFAGERGRHLLLAAAPDHHAA